MKAKRGPGEPIPQCEFCGKYWRCDRAGNKHGPCEKYKIDKVWHEVNKAKQGREGGHA